MASRSTRRKLRFSKGLNHGGEESQSSCFVCTMRHLDGAKPELCLYGAEKEPVLTVPFTNAPAGNNSDFEMRINGQEISLSLFRIYEATLPFTFDPKGLGPADDLITARFGVSPRKDLAGPTSSGKPGLAESVASIGSQLQFDIERTGYWRNADAFPKAPGILWKRPADDEAEQFVPGTPVADKGIVYFGDNRNRFHAVNAADGKDKWTRTYNGQVLAAPAIADDAAFVVTGNSVKCVAIATGEVRWSREVPANFTSAPPLVVGDAVFVAGGDGFYAFKRKDGNPIWNHNVLADRPVVTPSFASQFAAESSGSTRICGSASDGSLLFGAIYDQCRLIALDCRDGKQRWSYSTRGWPTAHPLVSGQFVLFGGLDLYIHCVDRETGKVIWKSPTAAEIDAAPAVGKGCVYFTARNSRAHCIDLETGKRIWMYRMDPAVEGMGSVCAALVSDKGVLFGSTNGFLFALDPLTGEFKWGLSLANRCQITNAGFATDGKRIFAATRGARFAQNQGAIVAVGDP